MRTIRRRKIRPQQTDVEICESKVRYESGAKANRVAKRLRGPSQSYRCPACGRFHLTSKKRVRNFEPLQ
jgi:hypothetical protein